MSGENKRRASPVSEGTLIDHVRECGTNFIDFCDENDDDGDSIQESVSSSSEEIVDDTDEDPTYDPNPDPGKRFRFVVRPRPSFQDASSTPLDCPGPSNRIPGLFEDDLAEENADDPDVGLVFDSIPRLENIVNLGKHNSHRPRASSSESETDDETEGRNQNKRSQHPRGRGRVNRGRGRGRGNRCEGTARPEPEPLSSDWEEVTDGNDNGYQHTFNFAELNGPKHCPPRNSLPINYFNLFFTINLLNSLTTETNKYAQQFLSTSNVSPRSQLKDWVNITTDEMKAFIAVILNMGIMNKPNIASYWYTSSSQHCLVQQGFQ